jgi:uncharacterized membrane protein YfcA
MTLNQGVFLFFAALAGGTLNSVAGGGGFIAFPALIFTGMPPINANATNTMALWPGTVASTGAYRNAFNHEVKPLMLPLISTSLFGALAGAVILLRTPQATFMKMVPWLLLAATLLFTFGGHITRWVRSRMAAEATPSGPSRAMAAFLQVFISVYIGFFGAGAGIMMLAMFAVLGIKSIHAMNGLKTMMASVCNGIAIVTFVVARAIFWPQAVLMLVGAIMGGYGGAYFAQRVRPQLIRYVVIATGAFMSTYFFIRY